MDKVIKLKMNEDKSLSILMEGTESIIISVDKREINAQQIFDFMNFQVGDQFHVDCENLSKIDAPVIDFFFELFTDIANSVNKLQFSSSPAEV